MEIFILNDLIIYTDTQIERLKKVGLRAFLMALTGVILPVALACAMFIPMHYGVSNSIKLLICFLLRSLIYALISYCR
jgi:Kef-type K+ transport system membrane component KefB